MEVIKDDYIRKIEAVKILQKAYTEGRIKAKDGCVSVLDDINALPKADAQPVVHGRWIDIYEWAKMHDSTPSGMCTYFWCSECQTEQEKRSNFCPNCGARMDGDTNG